MAEGAFLAVDWGGTRVRAWRLAADGGVQAQSDFPFGVTRIAPGEAAARFREDIRPAMDAESLPALMCGMVGSNIGWTLAPYLACPASPADLAGALVSPEPGVFIAPGLSCEGIAGPDVMRGEETQILGWLAEDSRRARSSRLICMPGTHSKWARVVDGSVKRFVTAMTGELHAVLGEHSILRFGERVEDPQAFEAGVLAAADGAGLSLKLFNLRGLTLTGGLPTASAPSWLSGLLIGSEIAVLWPLLRDAPQERVAIIGEGLLADLYGRALAMRKVASDVSDGRDIALLGLKRIWSALA